MHTSRKGLYQSCIKIGEIWICAFFFFSFSLTWDHYDRQKVQRTSCLKVPNRFAPKIVDTPRWGLCSTTFLAVWDFCGSQWGIIKCAISWKPLGVERNVPEFAPPWNVFGICRVLLTVKCSTSLWVTLGSLCVCGFSDFRQLVSRKRLAVEEKGIKCGPRGYLVFRVYGVRLTV